MIKNFEKTLNVQIDNTVIRGTVEKILDNIDYFDLGDYISDSLDTENKNTFEKMRASDNDIVAAIIDYVINAILEKFEIERSAT
ncbi:MAG: hypothetical protein II453_00500 [Alphaproteobacteria bacterium]|nr:hypothetical protein [Alphaproteobacteria bacterium]